MSNPIYDTEKIMMVPFRIDMAVADVPAKALTAYLMRMALNHTELVFDEQMEMVRFEAVAEGSDKASFTAGLLVMTIHDTILPVVVYTAEEHTGAGQPCESVQDLVDHGCPQELANQLVVMALEMFQDEEDLAEVGH
ncbi:hypothetical protein CMI37_28095 [Candidatus Pacearchaeota archaeon]|nr:hypothetical protein [Candidatus Pacearchaeota archaeon]|tara:strand:+ start:4887 stop:5297 length:411 start_codon:yes stop_codon:yes gene_type:complete